MRLLIQRVKHASVTIDGDIKSAINQGLLILIGIEDTDTTEDIEWLCGKVVRLRIFDDENGIMNKAVTDVADSGILVVSQFTLFASTKKGNRPSYIRASKPDFAVPMYENFVTQLQQMYGKEVQTGTFGADMQIELVNDGPVTIWIDSKQKE